MPQSAAIKPMRLEFDDNHLVPILFGENNKNLDFLEKELGVVIHQRGNQLRIDGPPKSIQRAGDILQELWKKVKIAGDLNPADVKAMVGFVEKPGQAPPSMQLKAKKKTIEPRTKGQAGYFEALKSHDLVFALGPAGTGKTYLAVAQAVSHLLAGDVDRIILSRPAVEAGEQLGFLPGDMKEKVDPYLRPLYDALHDMIPGAEVEKKMTDGTIEVAPLAFMRGRTLANAYVILDEGQNTTPTQMKMFLTRLGENSRMVITGDLSQIDLPPGTISGLKDALNVLSDIKGVSVVKLTAKDVVRHELVTRIVTAYDAADVRKKSFR